MHLNNLPPRRSLAVACLALGIGTHAAVATANDSGDEYSEHVVDEIRLGQGLFHERGVDEISVLADASAHAVLEEQPPFLVHVPGVPHVQPAACGFFRGGLRIFEVGHPGAAAIRLAGAIRNSPPPTETDRSSDQRRKR